VSFTELVHAVEQQKKHSKRQQPSDHAKEHPAWHERSTTKVVHHHGAAAW
jgi:hypothetical protein